MARDPFAPRRSGGGALLIVVILVVVCAGGFWLWGALRQGPAPTVAVESDRAAVGRAAKVVARFAEPDRGLGTVRLELVQGDKVVPLGERTFPRKGPFSFGRGTPTAQATIEATIGRDTQDWLKEGDVVLRATADRMSGSLRKTPPVVVEKKLVVKLRPPRLELMSQQHYIRQGGAGVVVFRTSEPAGRSGVRAGNVESLSYPLPGGGPGDRFALYAIPWELDNDGPIKLFSEDEAGNRAEASFVSIFKTSPPHHDKIKIDDKFLEKVVPAIASQTPGFDAKGTLLEQYLRINGEMRKQILAQIAELAKKSEPKFLWSGPFLQMKDSGKKANFAETRTYVYQGKDVDQQTHLGYDLASLAHAPVPAPNAGKVMFAGWLGIYGNAVIVDHGYGLMTLCGHLSSIAVKDGDAVTKGQVLGNTGDTGLAGGDHLHLEFFLQGKSINPKEWLDEHWIHDNIGTKVPLP